MQHLEVSGAARPLYGSLGIKGLITIHDTGLYDQIYNIKNFRRINKNSLNDFICILNFELWEDIFAEKEVNIIFNSFFKYIFKEFSF